MDNLFENLTEDTVEEFLLNNKDKVFDFIPPQPKVQDLWQICSAILTIT